MKPYPEHSSFDEVKKTKIFKKKFNDECNIEWALSTYPQFNNEISDYFMECLTEDIWEDYIPYPTEEHFLIFKKHNINLNKNYNLILESAEYHRIDVIKYLCKHGENINEYDGEYYVLDNFLFGHNNTYHIFLSDSEEKLNMLINMGANIISKTYIDYFREKFKKSQHILNIINNCTFA